MKCLSENVSKNFYKNKYCKIYFNVIVLINNVLLLCIVVLYCLYLCFVAVYNCVYVQTEYSLFRTL